VKKKTLLLDLFLTFVRIGLFTFGGGYAMISLITATCVEEKQWLSSDEMLNLTVVAESTPGPIAINSATYIGYRTAGFFGSLFATLGVCIPSFFIIFAISLFFDAFLSLTLVAYAFKGVQACVIYLILSAGLKMLKGIEKTPLRLALLAAVMLCMVTFSIFAISFSTILYILVCGAIGVMLYLLGTLKREVSK